MFKIPSLGIGDSPEPAPERFNSNEPQERRPWLLNAVLFFLTLATTLLAGAFQQGGNPLESPGEIWKGIPFSLTLILILGSHELGHFVVSRMHRVEVSLPYFIPGPTFIGTFGAFIRMKSPILDRKTLLDIGISGPLAGTIVAVPIILTGLIFSEIVPSPGPDGMTEGMILGDSLLFKFLNWMVHGPLPANVDVTLHPIAFSGWIGLFVTNLNLLPVGQLDGGHVVYALFGRKQKYIAWSVLIALVVLGLTTWIGWLVWAVLILFLGIKHPPVVYDWIPLDPKRRLLGWSALGLFVLTFMPAPF